MDTNDGKQPEESPKRSKPGRCVGPEPVNGPRRRQEQLMGERLSQLKPRDDEEGASPEAPGEPCTSERVQEEGPDSSEGTNVTVDHAQRIREYRERQQRKIDKKKRRSTTDDDSDDPTDGRKGIRR
jgi:hypothetical protein